MSMAPGFQSNESAASPLRSETDGEMQRLKDADDLERSVGRLRLEKGRRRVYAETRVWGWEDSAAMRPCLSLERNSTVAAFPFTREMHRTKQNKKNPNEKLFIAKLG